jgi:hypothetical protein
MAIFDVINKANILALFLPKDSSGHAFGLTESASPLIEWRTKSEKDLIIGHRAPNAFRKTRKQP